MKPVDGDRVWACEALPLPAPKPQFKPDIILTVLARFIVFLCCCGFCGGVGATADSTSSQSDDEEGDEGAGEEGSTSVEGMDISSICVGEVGERPVLVRSSPKKFLSFLVLTALASSGDVGVV